MVRLFVYGSLRTGLYNNPLLGKNTYVRDTEIKNYKMYSLGHYPFIMPGNGTIKGELHEITQENYNNIRQMEEGAGYKLIKGKTLDGTPTTYYVYEIMPTHRRPEIILGGDWKKWKENKK